MTFVKVTEEEFAKKTCLKKDVQALLEEFMSADITIARVDFNEREYKHLKSAHSSFHNAVKTGGFPIEVRCLNKQLYLIRKDS